MKPQKTIRVCFILDHKLNDYRLPLFKSLTEIGYDITLFHSGEINEKFDINKQRFMKRIPLGPLEYRIYPKLNSYDIVVNMQNLRIINLWYITLLPFRKYKLIHWGIGISSSKGLSNKKTVLSVMRNWLTNFADSVILYSEFPLTLYSKENRAKTFIAHNTIENDFKINTSTNQKDYFLFIGSLNKRKGLMQLIISFSNYLKHDQKLCINKLVIVGDGPMLSKLKELVYSLGIESNVDFCGKVADTERKIEIFKSAVATISPLQAGLSVLESFSYGVPFICFNNAISGGEHLNIIDGYNGFLVKTSNELLEKMIQFNINLDEARTLGNNAYKYYYSSRTMCHMVREFKKAFDYVHKINVD